MMLSPAEHDGLVSKFYASASGDMPWAITLASMSSLFGIGTNILNISDSGWNLRAVEVHGKPADHARDYYAGEIFANDPRRPYLQKVQPGEIYYDHMLYDVEEMARDPWCQEAFRALEVTYQLGAALRLPEGMRGAFALLSTEREGHASEAAIDSFARIAPHLEQAVSLGLVIEREAATRGALLEALSRKGQGMILLSPSAAPTFVNESALAMLAAQDGLSMSLGALVTRRPPETRRIQQLVRAALAPRGDAAARPGGRVLVTRPSGAPPYVVSVIAAPPLERFLAGQSIACIIHIQDLAAVRLPSPEALRAVFGLSAREADLAIELVRCAHIERAAANAGMALNTARNHLQNISRKTGARGQTELVQLLSRLD